MIGPFAKSELLSALQIRQGLVPCTVTTGNTVNTYDAAPQPAGGIDSWDAGEALFRNLLIIVDVASVSTTGTLVVTLRDDNAAITTSNGAANTTLAATLETISEAGVYAAEIKLNHIFPKTTARYIANANAEEIQRYHSIRAVATDATFIFNVLCIYGGSLRGFPAHKHTDLDVTWNTA